MSAELRENEINCMMITKIMTIINYYLSRTEISLKPKSLYCYLTTVPEYFTAPLHNRRPQSIINYPNGNEIQMGDTLLNYYGCFKINNS